MKRQVWLGCVGSTDCAITRHCSLASSRTWLSDLSRRGHALVRQALADGVALVLDRKRGRNSLEFFSGPRSARVLEGLRGLMKPS